MTHTILRAFAPLAKVAGSYVEGENPAVLTKLVLDTSEEDVTFYVPSEHSSGKPGATMFRGKLNQSEDHLEGERELGRLMPEYGENFIDDIRIGTWTLRKLFVEDSTACASGQRHQLPISRSA